MDASAGLALANLEYLVSLFRVAWHPRSKAGHETQEVVCRRIASIEGFLRRPGQPIVSWSFPPQSTREGTLPSLAHG